MTEPIVKDEPVIEVPPAPETVVPGAQTDPALLLKSLQEEREKRRIAEKEAEGAKKALLQTSPASSNGDFSDEGKILLGRISALEGILTAGQQREVINTLANTYPALKDKSAEFDSFRNDPKNAGMSIETSAKAFLIENDLLQAPAPRRGVEKPVGGGRTPTSDKMTADEIDELRINDFRKYSDLIRKGVIS